MRPVRVMSDALLNAAASRPEHEAVVTADERLSYAQLLERASRFATVLADSGVRRGDRVALFMDNSATTVACIYGSWLAGAVITLINPQTKSDKLRYILADAGAAFLVYDQLLAGVAEPALESAVSLTGSASNGGDLGARLAAAEPAPAAFVNPLDLAALIYTSGSTGNPKGVMMSHQNMVFTCGSLIEYLRLQRSDRIMNLLPLAFDYGLYQVFMAVQLGATLVLERNFSFPVNTLKRIEEEQVTVFPGVPTVFASLVSLQKRQPTALASVRRITNTAAHLPDDFIPSLRSLFPEALIYRMYGLTECKRVCFLEPELVDSKPGSVGKAIPGTEVFLLREDGSPAEPGETGVLHVRGPHVMLGYWNLPDETARMLKPGRLPFERVLCSHDLFRMDADGFLYFEGRSDDIIKSRGEKVSPVEVENALHAIPGVREAAVIGEPDELLGEKVVAFIVAEHGASLDERLLRREALARLEGFMVPGEFRLIAELPRTATGKVQHRALRQAVAVTDVP